ncbi:unnamed protein product [Hermetia illucens]|uniref:Apple domain-containing protein n=2 Tax=Hermetia illucens TaxID=343691 RepID=A0A7R8UBT6_HERIL|nr:unnamed protein product [Hermetia illucens]
MQECGHEKRFTCEGFNYRLDPSGHGQGDCELIEVPLAQMDLYSSPRNRDSNLLRHPDYDYYERDRNAPSSCRPSCNDCGSKPFSPVDYYRPDPKPYPGEPFPPSSPPSGPSGYGPRPDYFRPGQDTAIDKYRPPRPIYEPRPPPPPRPPTDYQHHYEGSISSHSSYGSEYHGTSFGGGFIDRYDIERPDDYPRPSRWEVQLPTSSGSGYEVHENYRPPYRPGSDYSPYREPDRYFPPSSSSYEYSGRDRSRYDTSSRFVPYLIGDNGSWGSYGGSYGRGSSSYSKNIDYWGLRGDNRRTDVGNRFNYFDLYGHDRDRFDYNDNFVWNYGGKYGHGDKYPPRDRPNYGSQWTRRPGPDECSVKSGEGFRLHKAVVRIALQVPSITECERMCFSENSFSCHTYSYRYTLNGRDNCLLCDRPVNLLDYYIDLQPDRDYDIYSMADDMKICSYTPRGGGGSGGGSTAVSDPRNNNMQCFFRAIDSTRFFKSIVRDSLTVRSIGECELECIKSSKFTCRAFAFRYGQRTHGGIIDNCQLSDWPVRDMDKERHLILDTSFDVFERASYGHGCELQPIVDEKHKKLCYLGYGSAAKLLPPAIKKAISVPTELECKKECVRLRETTPFKCYSFSFGSHASTYNCEMSDLDQTELKINVHYRHTNNRDYWLFAWNPFDWTCRDKVTTVGGSRVNNDRRMDIFREPGEVTWRHYTVSGKPCRLGSSCEKNLVTGFYSCEIESGEIGSWDYCCKSDHPCGYSKGFEYPWCFVGDEPDQWRKCSDRYFPGNNTHQGITYAPGDKRKPEHYQQPPRPGGLHSLTEFTAARLWPVTYLYSEGPPNSTELSNFVDCNKENCKRR